MGLRLRELPVEANDGYGLEVEEIAHLGQGQQWA
jgi:hypothetical protein